MKLLDKVLTEMYNTAVGTTVAGAGDTGAFGTLHSVVQPITTRDTKSDEDIKEEEEDEKKES